MSKSDILDGTRLRVNSNLIKENKGRSHWFNRESNIKPVITYQENTYMTPQTKVEWMMMHKECVKHEIDTPCEDLM